MRIGEHSKRASATKSGPGRYHRQGEPKASPIKAKGAPRGFVLHQASQAKRNRKALIAMAGGIRGFKRQMRANLQAEAA